MTTPQLTPAPEVLANVVGNITSVRRLGAHAMAVERTVDHARQPTPICAVSCGTECTSSKSQQHADAGGRSLKA